MEPTSLIYLPDGTVLDPAAVAVIRPADDRYVYYRLLGTPGPLSIETKTPEHALELRAYMVACKELATSPRETHLPMTAAADRERLKRDAATGAVELRARQLGLWIGPEPTIEDLRLDLACALDEIERLALIVGPRQVEFSEVWVTNRRAMLNGQPWYPRRQPVADPSLAEAEIVTTSDISTPSATAGLDEVRSASRDAWATIVLEHPSHDDSAARPYETDWWWVESAPGIVDGAGDEVFGMRTPVSVHEYRGRLAFGYDDHSDGWSHVVVDVDDPRITWGGRCLDGAPREVKPAIFSVREAIAETDLPPDMSSADAIRELWARLTRLSNSRFGRRAPVGSPDENQAHVYGAGVPESIKVELRSAKLAANEIAKSVAGDARGHWQTVMDCLVVMMSMLDVRCTDRAPRDEGGVGLRARVEAVIARLDAEQAGNISRFTRDDANRRAAKWLRAALSAPSRVDGSGEVSQDHEPDHHR